MAAPLTGPSPCGGGPGCWPATDDQVVAEAAPGDQV